MKRYRVDEGLSLRLLGAADAAELFALVEANRAYLGAWLRWVDATRDVQAMRRMVEGWETLREQTGAQHWGVEVDGQLGGAVYHLRPNAVDRQVEVGYWLVPAASGRGAVTRGVRLLIDYTFRDMGYHRVQVRIAPHNAASLAVAQRLGLVREGVTRHAWRVGDQWWDAVEFSVLEDEWTVTTPPVRFRAKEDAGEDRPKSR